MARFYQITLTPTPQSPAGAQGVTWSSFPSGTYDPGALTVELDLLAADFATPMGNCTVTVEGIGLEYLFAAQQFAGMNIAISGGLKPPSLGGAAGLANTQCKPGLLITGSVFQPFGNWIGTDMNINFVVIPSVYTYVKAGNLVFNWQKGQSLQEALRTTLSTAYPDSALVFQISSSYTTSMTIAHTVQTLTQLAQMIESYTSANNSLGVRIAMRSNGTIIIFDGTVTATNGVAINFDDLIGQPQWVSPDTMQVTTFMRSDIEIGATITMPKGLPGVPGAVTTTGASLPAQYKYQTAFQGKFLVQAVRHIGNSRDADGASWASVYQAVSTSA